MDERPIMIDLKNVKKRYLIRHNFKKPDTFSGRIKLAANRILHPTKKYDNEEFWALDGITFQVRQGEKVGIIGKNGAMLKKIGTNARFEIERMLDCRIYLKLYVKVRNNWRDSQIQMKNFGYNSKEIL